MIRSVRLLAVAISSFPNSVWERGKESYTAHTFTKNGTGKLTMVGSSTYGGTTDVTAGTLALGNPGSSALFSGSTTVESGGTLEFFESAGHTGPDYMSYPVTINGGGTMVIDPNVSVELDAAFTSNGTLTLQPGASSSTYTLLRNSSGSPLTFGDGSYTTIATPLTAGQFLAGIDLHGQNANVSGSVSTSPLDLVGAVFINNGFVSDSTISTTSAITVDGNKVVYSGTTYYGGLVKGAGYFQRSVVTYDDGHFQAGNSPGSDTVGDLVLGPGGVANYLFCINDAAGAAGPHPDANGQVSGWSVMNSAGDFAWTADAAHKFTVQLQTLANPTTIGDDVAGPMDHFDPSQHYVWEAVHWTGTYTGPTDDAALNAATVFNTGAVANALGGKFSWQLDTDAKTLSLVYTPPPAVAAVDLSGSSITVTFSTAVSFAGGDVAAAFRLTNVDTGATVGLTATVSTDAQGRTVVTLTFDPTTVASGNYRLSILGSDVTGSDGTALDGSGTGTGNGIDYLGSIWAIG